jgi:glycosyltransferase involved in cell wall biosynthesis
LKIDRIIFWQPFASPHQEAFLEAVAEQFPGEVILGVESDLPPERIAQGWRKPEHKRVRVVDISNPENHAALASHRGPDSLHVFTGFFSHPLVWAGFHKLKSSQARLAIYSEAPEQPWHTGWLKRLRGRWLAVRHAKRFAFVLAIGGIGCEFFERIGFPEEKIVPFGYYLAVPPLPTEPARSHDRVFRFISAGQLIHRKGIDLLIKACEVLPQTGWHLDIYGDGPQRRRLEHQAARLALSERVSFHGMVSNDAVQRAIAAADCAVLPSRFDGWGMLVNEALAVGTPVICTRGCGSATVIAGDAALGCVVTHENALALNAALESMLQAAARRPSREGVLARASERISANVAAQRFCRACESPWLDYGSGSRSAV